MTNRFGNLELDGDPIAQGGAPADTITRRIEVEGVSPQQAIAQEQLPDVQITEHKGVDFFGRATESADAAYAPGGFQLRALDGVTTAQGGIRAMAQASGKLDFTIARQPTYVDLNGKQVPTGYYALIPSHKDEIWNPSVSGQYEVVQPLDGLLPLEQLDRATSMDLAIDRIGAWRGGRLVYAQTKPVEFGFTDSDGVDQVYKGRFMVWNGLDGKTGWGAAGGVIDTACWNAMRSNMNKGVSLRHIAGINDQIKVLGALLASAPQHFHNKAQQLEAWSRIAISDGDVFRMLGSMFRKQKDGTYSSATLGKVRTFLDVYREGKVDGKQIVPNARPGTLEGFNRAATAYNTHINAVRSGRDGDVDAQWEYLMQGSGYSWQSKADAAMHQTVALVGAR